MSIYDEILQNNVQQTQEPQGINQQINKQSSPIITKSAPQSYYTDPRPDLIRDHHFWVKILTNAQAMYDEHKPVNGGETSLYKILHGIRCGGGKLEETQQGFKLHPGSEEWAAPGAWDKVRKDWLDPVKEDLLKIFKLSKLGQVVDEELPPGVFESAAPVPEKTQEVLFK